MAIQEFEPQAEPESSDQATETKPNLTALLGGEALEQSVQVPSELSAIKSGTDLFEHRDALVGSMVELTNRIHEIYNGRRDRAEIARLTAQVSILSQELDAANKGILLSSRSHYGLQ